MNLQPSIAITQNFVSTENLPQVLRFLSKRRDQVSGCQDGDALYERFVDAFKKSHPGVLEKVMEDEGLGKKVKGVGEVKVGLWDRIGKSAEDNGERGGDTFSFSF